MEGPIGTNPSQLVDTMFKVYNTSEEEKLKLMCVLLTVPRVETAKRKRVEKVTPG